MEQDEHGKRDIYIPDWVKFAGSIIATLIFVIAWAEARFVSRVEWTQHAEQQRIDLSNVTKVQDAYARAESKTAENLAEINTRLTRIETILKYNATEMPK